MKTIGHVRMEVGDVSILGSAYRATEIARATGQVVLSDAAMIRFRSILHDLHALSQAEMIPGSSDVWGLAA